MSTVSPNVRLREARERLGLTIDELASRIGINSPSIWDIESSEGELTQCYSPREIVDYCRALQISPVDLFGAPDDLSAVSEPDLIVLIHAECRRRNQTLDQFEDVVGWKLADAIKSPKGLLGNLSVDGLQWLCRELRVDWRRVMASVRD